MFSNQFPFPLISTANEINESFPTDILEPELPTIHLQSETYYDFPMVKIYTCTICTLTFTQALPTL